MNLVLLGPPGAGKGTQAKLICEKYNIPHISTGDIFRKNISEETALGKLAKNYIDRGALVPDDVTIKIVEQRLKEADCENGFLLDGFPRTVSQAEAFESILSKDSITINKVLFIKVPNEIIIERNSGRRICSCCGHSFHIKFKPSKFKDKCEFCNGQLIQRQDDNITAIYKRLDVYETETNSLINFYGCRGKLSLIEGAYPVEVVFRNILSILE